LERVILVGVPEEEEEEEEGRFFGYQGWEWMSRLGGIKGDLLFDVLFGSIDILLSSVSVDLGIQVLENFNSQEDGAALLARIGWHE